MKLDEEYWTNRYKNNMVGWDIGYASTPIVKYFENFENKNLSILIPGAGFGHEAFHLVKEGFTNITVCDLSPVPLEKFENSPIKTICGNFFELDGKYDIIIEQTFFCAIDPNLRKDYTKKVNELLTNNGILVGILFGIEFEKEGPPFGGSLKEYILHFKESFNIIKMEPCYNSIPQRQGSEIFILFKKK